MVLTSDVCFRGWSWTLAGSTVNHEIAKKNKNFTALSFRKLAGQSWCKLMPTTFLIRFPVIELAYTVGELWKTILWLGIYPAFGFIGITEFPNFAFFIQSQRLSKQFAPSCCVDNLDEPLHHRSTKSRLWQRKHEQGCLTKCNLKYN